MVRHWEIGLVARRRQPSRRLAPRGAIAERGVIEDSSHLTAGAVKQVGRITHCRKSGTGYRGAVPITPGTPRSASLHAGLISQRLPPLHCKVTCMCVKSLHPKSLQSSLRTLAENCTIIYSCFSLVYFIYLPLKVGLLYKFGEHMQRGT